MYSKIESILLGAKLVDELQIKAAHAYQNQWGGRLANAVVEKGFAEEPAVVEALANGLRLHSFNLDGIQKDELALTKFDGVYAREKGVFPIAIEDHGRVMLLAMADPTDIATLDEVALKTRLRIKTVIAGERMILRAIERHYFGREASSKPKAFGHIEIGVADSGEFAVVDFAGNDVRESPQPAPPPAAPAAAATALQTNAASALLDSLMGEALPAQPEPLTAQQIAELQSLKAQYEKAARVTKVLIELCMEKHVFDMNELRVKLSKL